jgi:hypothetical protein
MTVQLLDATARLSEFEDDLERAIADLKSAIEDIVDSEDEVEDVNFSTQNGVPRLDVTALGYLLGRLDDAPEETAAAFETFDWKTRRAPRALKQALVRETAS